jgi:hypothetical protein
LKKAFKYLNEWDYRLDLDKIAASIFLAYEFSFATYFQESKIDDADVRRGLHGNVIFDNFAYSEIHKWAN